MAKLKGKPETFKTQREAYWYRQGWKDAIQEIIELGRNRIDMYKLDYLDHLPTGQEREGER